MERNFGFSGFHSFTKILCKLPIHNYAFIIFTLVWSPPVSHRIWCSDFEEKRKNNSQAASRSFSMKWLQEVIYTYIENNTYLYIIIFK